jgi:class 3 adenylate cyclase
VAEQRMERRLAAILAGDVAGYSRLMGVDEEGTLARLNAHRLEFLEPTIAEHGGRIVKRTGDTRRELSGYRREGTQEHRAAGARLSVAAR